MPSAVLTKVIDMNTIRVRWTDNSDNEDGFIVQRAEDENFETGVKNFQVGPNTTVFTDTVPVPAGKHYFYRVRAFSNFSGPSVFSDAAEAFALVPGEMIIDNASSGNSFRLTGSWTTRTGQSQALYGSSVDDGNSGKGSKTALFVPNVQFTDDYFVYARWVGGSDRATNVLYDVFYGTNGEKHTTLTVNQRQNGGGWVLLGKFHLEKGTSAFVRVRNYGTDGVVSVDAMRFLPANGQ